VRSQPFRISQDVSSVGFLLLSSRIEQDLAQPGRYRHNSPSTMWFAD
jgi:hypothetical protein